MSAGFHEYLFHPPREWQRNRAVPRHQGSRVDVVEKGGKPSLLRSFDELEVHVVRTFHCRDRGESAWIFPVPMNYGERNGLAARIIEANGSEELDHGLVEFFFILLEVFPFHLANACSGGSCLTHEGDSYHPPAQISGLRNVPRKPTRFDPDHGRLRKIHPADPERKSTLR